MAFFGCRRLTTMVLDVLAFVNGCYTPATHEPYRAAPTERLAPIGPKSRWIVESNRCHPSWMTRAG